MMLKNKGKEMLIIEYLKAWGLYAPLTLSQE